MNHYTAKKTISQAMLDIALLSANASQLKYVLQVKKITATVFYSITKKKSWQQPMVLPLNSHYEIDTQESNQGTRLAQQLLRLCYKKWCYKLALIITGCPNSPFASNHTTDPFQQVDTWTCSRAHCEADDGSLILADTEWADTPKIKPMPLGWHTSYYV